MLPRFLFPGQQENEEILLVIREHWFYLFTKLLAWGVFILVLFLADHYVPAYLPGLVQDPYLAYYDLFKNVFLVSILLGLFMIWALYYLNIQVITNERIVDISQESLFDHRVSELSIAKIEDVTGETHGFFGTVFSFGNVRVQTAGTQEFFLFENIPHPDKVEKLILDLYEKQSQVHPNPEV